MQFLLGFGLGAIAGGVAVYLYAQKAIAKLKALATSTANDIKKAL